MITIGVNTEESKEVFPEHIEYCQYVYFHGKNPLDEECDKAQVERSLKIDFSTYYD